MIDKIKNWFKSTFHKLLAINDPPQKKALGLGLGVFLGNLPGLGPIAAWVVAYLLQVNQAAALLGCFLTNTWLSFLTLVISVKIGSSIRGQDWHRVKSHWDQLVKDFHWYKLVQPEILNTLYSLLVGYFVVSLTLGLLAYLTALWFLKYKNKTVIKKVSYGKN